MKYGVVFRTSLVRQEQRIARTPRSGEKRERLCYCGSEGQQGGAEGDVNCE
jgi:hypothetical protein